MYNSVCFSRVLCYAVVSLLILGSCESLLGEVHHNVDVALSESTLRTESGKSIVRISFLCTSAIQGSNGYAFYSLHAAYGLSWTRNRIE